MDVKFIPIQSYIDSSFFTRLSELKLNDFKLDATPQLIQGVLNNPLKLNKFNNVPVLNLNYNSFDITQDGGLDHQQSSTPNQHDETTIQGYLYNVNTIEEFKTIDKQQLLRSWGKEIMDEFNHHRFLNQFRILTFCDLKKYKFYYWVAYPVWYSKWEISKIDESLIDVNAIDIFKQWQIINDQYIFIDNCLDDHQLSNQLKNFLYFINLTTGKKQVVIDIFKHSQFKQYHFNLIEATEQIVGWERTNNGKLGPKLANLGNLIDPLQLANQAVDLNLKLMKWRIAPSLNLDIISQQRVLLLGAGTLGSYVSRCLLGWGVKHITFVDNGRISFSNPVRQPLFNFKDCFSDENGLGAIKAIRASEALKEIYPGVYSTGIELEVPMIGHMVKDEAKIKQDYLKLNELFDNHDIIYLLMDSRESRWLPTVMGVAKNKLVINAALGFDSYLILRHGTKSLNLGCYYCNDVVAPNDSLTDRTLDQMCTVTRPGAALMASSLSVELMVSILQHPMGKDADINGNGNLGEIPHQIRGFLSNFQQHKLSTPKYKYCSGCSSKVVDNYLSHDWQFIKNCLNDVKYLEDICGLTEIQQQAELASEELMKQLEIASDDEDDEWLS